MRTQLTSKAHAWHMGSSWFNFQYQNPKPTNQPKNKPKRTMTAKETQKPPLKNLFLIMSVFSVCVHVCPVVHGCQERASFPELELEVVAICPMCGLEPKWYTLITPDTFLQTPTPLLLKCNFDIGIFTDLQASGSNKDLNLGTFTSCPGQEIDQQQVISLPGFF